MQAVSASTLPSPRKVTGEFGLYIHVPFCVHRCWYCDFNAYAGLDHLAPAYMDALARDAALGPLADRPKVTSVFFGGGTPSRVPASDLLRVLAAIRDEWDLAPGAEVTVECNPESIEPDKLEAYRAGGVTRLSIGVQSLDDALLQTLGRAHDAVTATRAVQAARKIFDDVNLDLIFGTPGEDDGTWRDTLSKALDLGTTHMSCYGLTYEEGTPLDEWRKLGRITPEPDDDVARRWEIADEVLTAAGLVRYEISNWSRPGRECRHNLLYWACGEYLGIGAGAHSHIDGRRSWTVKAPAAYVRAVDANQSTKGGDEEIDAAGRAAEVMFLGLRRTSGVTAADFASLTGRDLQDTYGRELDDLAAKGLLEWDGRTARLTQRGTLLANEAVCEFLSSN